MREGKLRLCFYARASDTLQSAKRTSESSPAIYRWERDKKAFIKSAKRTADTEP